jgi:hypothetical protein
MDRLPHTEAKIFHCPRSLEHGPIAYKEGEMKTFSVFNQEVNLGIAVVAEPYLHVVLGEGGHKSATWIPLGKHDVGQIVVEGKIADVGVIALKDAEGKPTGKYLIVAPRGVDDRILVFWSVSSGYRGSANITPGEGVTVIAKDVAWHSGRGNLGEDAEILAILKPGQVLKASMSGRRMQYTKAVLTYDGASVSVIFGGGEMEEALVDTVEGEYV